MSYIKFDDDELIDFFINELIVISEYECGELIFYDTDKIGIKLCLTIDVYSKYINLSISFNEISIFKGKFYNVNEIIRSGNNIYIYFQNNNSKYKKRMRITRENNLFGASLEEDTIF